MFEKIFDQLIQQGLSGIFALAVLYIIDKYLKEQLRITVQYFNDLTKFVNEFKSENNTAHSKQWNEHTKMDIKLDALKNKRGKV